MHPIAPEEEISSSDAAIRELCRDDVSFLGRRDQLPAMLDLNSATTGLAVE